MELREKKDKGFTLVELLIVIVILGILATVVALSVTAITSDSKQKVCETAVANVQTAWEAAYAASGGDAPEADDINERLRDMSVAQIESDHGIAFSFNDDGVTLTTDCAEAYP